MFTVKSGRFFHYNPQLADFRYVPDQLTNKKSKTTNINELIINQEIVTEPEKIADSLSAYFNESGTVLAKDLPKSNNSFETYVGPTNKSFEIYRLSSIDARNAIL